MNNLKDVLAEVLAASQDFMRKQQDECSFVSLRDVERVLQVMVWFYNHREHLYDRMDTMEENKLNEGRPNLRDEEADDSEEEEVEEERPVQDIDALTRSLILALGVCYHACLEKRNEYRHHVAPYFNPPCRLPRGEEDLICIIDRSVVNCRVIYFISTLY